MGRAGAARLAVLFSFVALSAHHALHGGSLFDLAEFQVVALFLVVALAAAELADRAMKIREQLARAEFREARLGRVLAAASAGVSLDNLVAMVEYELADELDLDMVRYESDPRTSSVYHLDRQGGLNRDGERLSGLQLRLPPEPVLVPVRSGGTECGQLVLIPRGRSAVSEEQLLLTTNFASVLAGLVPEADPSSGPASGGRLRRDDRAES